MTDTSCCKCAKPIDAGPSLEALGKSWHQDCFACGHCKKKITSPEFRPKDEDVVCGPCWMMLYQKKCQSCRVAIDEDKQFFTVADKSYHKKCYTCQTCHLPLAGKKAFMKSGQLVCESHAK